MILTIKLIVVKLLVGLVIFLGLNGCKDHEIRQKSSNMEPTIVVGEVLHLDMDSYIFSKPARWDVVVFDDLEGVSGEFVSRIVGLPGEHVDINSKGLFINRREVKVPKKLRISQYEPPNFSKLYTNTNNLIRFPRIVEPGHYFVLGDNTTNSYDSRYWGDLEASKIIGKVFGK